MSDDKPDLQTLLDALNGPVSSKARVDPNLPYHDIKRFIEALNVRSHASCKVPLATIYDSFLNWTTRPISKHKFARIFDTFFKPRNSKYNKIYPLAPDSFGLPEEYSVYKDPLFNQIKNAQPRDEYIGVYIYPDNRIVARITLPNGISKYLGAWPSLKQAAIAYDKNAIELYGTTAVLNFPDKWNKKAKNEKKEES